MSTLRKCLTWPLWFCLGIGNRVLHHLECGIGGKTVEALNHSPVFIIGPPRSGSTLLYQVMLDAFGFGYLSNFHCLFHGAPAAVEHCLRPGRYRRRLDYGSQHGTTTGLASPSECGQYWYRFFRRFPQYVNMKDADPRRMHQLRASVALLTDACGRPVLFKNMNCALRLRPLCSALPEALFIVTTRDLPANARSLLQVRQRMNGNYHQWWSMQPPEIDEIRFLPPAEQVVEQIRCIHNLIARDSEEIGPERFLYVSYESLCSDTNGEMKRVATFLGSRGVSVKRLERAIPHSFPISAGPDLPDSIRDDLERYLGSR